MATPVQRRRERLRAETVSEIKALALEQMSAGGPASISLRAIAREMGMTAGALYSYYDTRDDLVRSLVADVYASLADALEAALESRPADDHTGRLLAVGHAYRAWAIARPQEYRLLYGDQVADYWPREGAMVLEAQHRACVVLLSAVSPGAYDSERASTPSFAWEHFEPDFAAKARKAFPDLPPEGVALSLRLWSRMHGLVWLEIYGHLDPQVRDHGRLFEAELLDLVRTLGLDAPADK